MRVKVIKEIKGLVPGDILYYNDKTDMYEITKTDYDVSDSGQSVKSVKVVISSYVAEESKDYFVFVDDDNNDIEINKIYWDDIPQSKKLETPKNEQVKSEAKDTDSKDSEINKLQEQVKELEEKLEDIKRSKKSIEFNSPFWVTNFPTSRYWLF